MKTRDPFLTTTKAWYVVGTPPQAEQQQAVKGPFLFRMDGLEALVKFQQYDHKADLELLDVTDPQGSLQWGAGGFHDRSTRKWCT